VATNYSASLGKQGFVEASTHEEVQEMAKLVEEGFGRLIVNTIQRFQKKRLADKSKG